MSEPMSEDRLAECSMCGGRMSRNPHPDAGLLAKLSEVGAIWECIPCAVSGRSKAYWRAVAAEGESDRLRAENERLQAMVGELVLAGSMEVAKNKDLRAENKRLRDHVCEPTQWAYDRACAALHKHKAEEDRLRAENERLTTAFEELLECHAVPGYIQLDKE